MRIIRIVESFLKLFLLRLVLIGIQCGFRVDRRLADSENLGRIQRVHLVREIALLIIAQIRDNGFQLLIRLFHGLICLIFPG